MGRWKAESPSNFCPSERNSFIITHLIIGVYLRVFQSGNADYKPWPLTPACCIKLWLLCFWSSFLKYLGEQWNTVQSLSSLPFTWETKTVLWAPSFGLAKSQLLKPFQRWTSEWREAPQISLPNPMPSPSLLVPLPPQLVGLWKQSKLSLSFGRVIRMLLRASATYTSAPVRFPAPLQIPVSGN